MLDTHERACGVHARGPTLNLDTTVNTGARFWPEGSSWDFSSGSAGNSTLSRGSWDCCRSLVSSGGTGSYGKDKAAGDGGGWGGAAGPAQLGPREEGRPTSEPRGPETRCEQGCLRAGCAGVAETS